jgi:hypothetical protein
MTRTAILLLGLATAFAPAPAFAGAANFTLVNNTDIAFTGLMARRFGTDQWVPLTVAPVPVANSGGRGAVQFSDQDCAFDLQAKLPDGRTVVWQGVNLCDATVVTLNRGAGGELWVDYR